MGIMFGETFPDYTRDGAVFDDPVRPTHRYLLWRVGLRTEPKYPGWLAWSMLNPSKAGYANNDNTITRCMDYTRSAGYGRMLVVNFYALIATDPNELIAQLAAHGSLHARGPDNVIWTAYAYQLADMIVCAWGGQRIARHLAMAEVWRQLLKHGTKLHALAVTGEGAPGHPLRRSRLLTPVPVRLGLLGKVFKR